MPKEFSQTQEKHDTTALIGEVYDMIFKYQFRAKVSSHRRAQERKCIYVGQKTETSTEEVNHI